MSFVASLAALTSSVDMDQKSKQVVQPLETNTLTVAKTVLSQPPVTVYPSVAQYTSVMKTYPGSLAQPTQAIPQNVGYVVSGTPEEGNMKLSLIPDEDAKHSSKERERR